MDVLNGGEIRETEVQPLVGSGLRQLDGLRGDVIAPESRVAAQFLLKLHQDFSDSASDIANGCRRNMILPKHAQNLLGFPR